MNRVVAGALLFFLCAIGGCTCTPQGGVHGVGTVQNGTGQSTAVAAPVASETLSQDNLQIGAQSTGAAAEGDGSIASGVPSTGPARVAATSQSIPTEFPPAIVGQAVRLDKPVQEPQPGYLIIPDDKPADQYMAGLPPTREWKSFVMAGTNLSDNGLFFFPRFPAVQTLDASNTRVSDEGMRHLQKAKALQVLSLRNTQVTDAGLEFLKQIKTLKLLDLTGTPVTDQGVASLQDALPGLQIQR